MRHRRENFDFAGRADLARVADVATTGPPSDAHPSQVPHDANGHADDTGFVVKVGELDTREVVTPPPGGLADD